MKKREKQKKPKKKRRNKMWAVSVANLMGCHDIACELLCVT